MKKHFEKASTSILETIPKLWPIFIAIMTFIGSMYLSQYRLVKTEDEIKAIKDKQTSIWIRLSEIKSELARLDERTKARTNF